VLQPPTAATADDATHGVSVIKNTPADALVQEQEN
jgi:hypothetical protein